ncbi:MAG: 3-hydroxyacyl-CoA dehydrogenase [Planctomycetes bacterium]|nr:3-hydroxyacyl-CoA dehydrogenase [Planctomycetota bacterium]
MSYIYKVGVVGAGQMGAGIAQTISFAGIPVVLKDVSDVQLKKGLDQIRSVYNLRASKGKMTAEEVELKMQLVTPSLNYSDFSDCDLVIEAVPEDLNLKMSIFTGLKDIIPEHCIVSSNTSSLSISKMATAIKSPKNFIGFHFFYPANVMKLVEIILGLQTDQAVADSIVAFSESIRKIPVKVKECPGFLVNRLLMPYLNEACHLVQEKACTPEKIDEIAVKFGLPMGPFMLVDHLGLDVCHHVSCIMADAYGSRAKPPELISTLIGLKRYGKKSGAGFYVYDGSSKDFSGIYPSENSIKDENQIIERLLYPMVNEAANCIDESIANPSDIDLSLLAGIGFPQAKNGLLRWADQTGLDLIFNKLCEWNNKSGDRFLPSLYLRRLADAGFTGSKAGRGFFDYF